MGMRGSNLLNTGFNAADRVHNPERDHKHSAVRLYANSLWLGRPLNGPQPPSTLHEIRQIRGGNHRRLQPLMVEPQAQHAPHLHKQQAVR